MKCVLSKYSFILMIYICLHLMYWKDYWEHLVQGTETFKKEWVVQEDGGNYIRYFVEWVLLTWVSQDSQKHTKSYHMCFLKASGDQIPTAFPNSMFIFEPTCQVFQLTMRRCNSCGKCLSSSLAVLCLRYACIYLFAASTIVFIKILIIYLGKLAHLFLFP